MGDNRYSSEAVFCIMYWVKSGLKEEEASDEELDDERLACFLNDPRKPNNPVKNERGLPRICAGCKRGIGNEGHWNCMGTFFHTRCCSCRVCGRIIYNSEIVLSGNNQYHTPCYDEMMRLCPKCDVCRQFVPLNRAGQADYIRNAFWSQKYCRSHEHDNTPRCHCCERLQISMSFAVGKQNKKRKPWNAAAYSLLRDGRRSCSECMGTVMIMGNAQCQLLYQAIRAFYLGTCLMLGRQISVLLVSQNVIPGSRSTCIMEEHFVCPIETRSVVKRREVTAIHILHSLPSLLAGAILAGHLMEALLCSKSYCSITHEVKEGICKVLSHMWLKRQVPRHLGEFERRLGKFIMFQYERDYWFKEAQAAVDRYGLRPTIDYVCHNGNLPS